MASSVANSLRACWQLTEQYRQNCPLWHPQYIQFPYCAYHFIFFLKKKQKYKNAGTRLQNRHTPKSPETHRVRFSWQSLAECLRSGGFTQSGVISSRQTEARDSQGTLLNTHKGSVTGVIEMCPSLCSPSLFHRQTLKWSRLYGGASGVPPHVSPG